MFLMDFGEIFGEGPMRVLGFFIKHPHNEFYLREISRKTGLSASAVKKYCDLLVGEKLLEESRKGNLRYFKPNLESRLYLGIKSSLNAQAVIKAGIVDYILENIPNTSSITLFGSMAQGLDDENSDIDLLVIGKRPAKRPDYPEKLGRELNVHTYSWQQWKKKAGEDPAFYNEVVSKGTSLYGEKPTIT